MKIADSPLYTFCHTSKESIEYLFYQIECKFSQDFWKSVVVLWLQSLDMNSIGSLNDCDIILDLSV